VRVGAQQAIKREVEASERNTRPRICFDVTVEDLALCFPGEKELSHYSEYCAKRLVLEAWHRLRDGRAPHTDLPQVK
jgi:hypothetical protein